MQSLLQIALILISLQTILFSITKCQTIQISTSQTTNKYLKTSSVGWGTPTQKFNFLVDTTDHTSWVYNGSANTPQSKFKSSDSSSFTLSTEKITYAYQGVSMSNVYKANDTITIDNTALTKQSFGIATENFTITDDEGLSGFLALDRKNTIISGLYKNEAIGNQTVTIDVPNNKMYFGPHTPSPINTLSNATSCSSTTNNEYLDADWTFDADVAIDGSFAATQGSVKLVIDSGSPYITIYARTDNLFTTFWHKVDHTTDTFNCNYTTRLCDNTGTIMESMTIYVGSSVDGYTWTVNISRDDVLSGSYVQFYYDADRDFTDNADCGDYGNCDYVLFLGRPFLQNVVVTLDYKAEEITFYTLNSTSSSLNWVTIGVVFGSVAAFALLFFGLYYWKYGRIPPPSNNDVEEQSLLRGPSVQAVGTGQGANQGAMYQGMSDPVGAASGSGGLDDEEDAFNRQLQNARRQSEIEAQQQRERQLREDAQRREREEMEQQAQLQQAQSRARKEDRGGRLGGSGDKPQDADDLRARRLKFLEDQEKKANEQGDDQ